MNAALRASLLALALGASCTWYTGPVVTVGTLQVLWTFNGGQSCSAAGVSTVQVAISGSSFNFYCYDPLSGVQGATLYNVAAGTQPVIVTGYSGNQPLYQWSGNLLAYGGSFNSYRVDLPFINTGTNNSNVTFLWTFGGASCVQAGVSSVNISVQDPINGNVNTPFPCTKANVDGAMVIGFSAGTYPFTLSVLGGNGQPLYRALGTATVNGQSSITVHVDLQPGYPPITGQGNASVGLVFAGKSCSQANVSQILAELRDLSGTVVSKTTVSCTGFTGSLSFTSISAAATYYLDAVGSATDMDGGTNVLYQLTGEGLTIQPSSTSSYNLDVPPA
jgi:hypothetical protein